MHFHDREAIGLKLDVVSLAGSILGSASPAAAWVAFTGELAREWLDRAVLHLDLPARAPRTPSPRQERKGGASSRPSGTKASTLNSAPKTATSAGPMEEAEIAALSLRERQILAAPAEGAQVAAIAARLAITER